MQEGGAVLGCDILLTLKEAMYFENKTWGTVNKYIQRGKIQAEKLDTGLRCGFEYRVPLTELSKKAQQRYFKERRENAPERLFVDEDVGEEAEDEKRPVNFELLTNEQRLEALRWETIIRLWQAEVAFLKDKKTEATKEFVRKYNNENEPKISVRTLYEKDKAYKKYGVTGLADMRKSRKKRGTRMDERLYSAFVQWYLNENRLTISYIYENIKRWVEQEGLDIKVPSEASFRRAAESIPVAAIKLFRYGSKVYSDECEPFVQRLYDDIYSNDYWSSDYHTLDLMVKDDVTGEIYRPHLCTWIDVRSRKVLAMRLRKSADSHGVVLCFKDAVGTYGLPGNVYLDNGREFLVHDFGGRGRRKTDSNAFYGTGILERLGITMINAIVRNGKAKVIERSFKQITSEFAKLYITYCGNRPENRPYAHNTILKNEKNIPLASAVKKDLENYIFGIYNENVSEAEGIRGKSPNEAYAENLITKRVLKKDQLNLMLLRNAKLQSVDRNGVFIKIAGAKIWYYDADFVSANLKRKVYVRYDPDELTSVRVYDENEVFMAELKKMPTGGYDMASDIEAIKYVNAGKKKLATYTKHFIENQKEIMKVKPLRDIVMRTASEQRQRISEEESAVVFANFNFTETECVKVENRINFKQMIESAKRQRG